MSATHEVSNQAPPLVGYDAFTADLALTEGVRRYGGGEATPVLTEFGRYVGSEPAQAWAVAANTHEPVLRTHDRYGHRVEEVEFHPSWHELMHCAVEAGLAGAAWADPKPAAHVRRAAAFYLDTQLEAGHLCPISMTYAVVPALRHAPELAATYEPGLTATVYDFGLRDPAGKVGLISGMGMTEKQGGSDVRANTTTAVATGDGSWRLTGHKWFCSAPMSDLFLVLAQVEGVGVSCFLVPRVLPGGERNVFALQRLKDKLGNRSNASSEVEFDGTVGWPVGDPGRGVQTILEMVSMTRLDCVVGSAALQRAALVQAVHHATHRRAFGAALRDQPAMRAVLADLAIESEASIALGLRLAAAVDAAPNDQGEAAYARLALAAAKFWVCKRTPIMVAEALECLGGNGYVEESGLPRIYREAPLNSIWEGSGNVIALDILRALGRGPEALSAVEGEIAAAAGADPRLDAAASRLRVELSDLDGAPARARRIASLLAVVLQGSLLVRHAPAAVADAFCATRLAGDWAPVLGTLPPGTDQAAILDRAFQLP